MKQQNTQKLARDITPALQSHTALACRILPAGSGGGWPFIPPSSHPPSLLALVCPGGRGGSPLCTAVPTAGSPVAFAYWRIATEQIVIDHFQTETGKVEKFLVGMPVVVAASWGHPAWPRTAHGAAPAQTRVRTWTCTHGPSRDSPRQWRHCQLLSGLHAGLAAWRACSLNFFFFF